MTDGWTPIGDNSSAITEGWSPLGSDSSFILRGVEDATPAPVLYSSFIFATTGPVGLVLWPLNDSHLGGSGIFEFLLRWRFKNDGAGTRVLTFSVDWGTVTGLLTWTLSVAQHVSNFRQGVVQVRIASAGATNAQLVDVEYKDWTTSFADGSIVVWGNQKGGMANATQDIAAASRSLQLTVATDSVAAGTQTFYKQGAFVKGPSKE